MTEPTDSKDNRDGAKPKPNFTAFSPFPYGSPLAQGSLQTSFSGSPGQRLLLGSFNQSRVNGEVVTPRLKGQDLYGGPVMFGGSSSARRSRLQSSSPYSAALRIRNADRKSKQVPLNLPPALGASGSSLPPSSLPSTAPSSPQSSPVPSSDLPAPLSSTAKQILSTLDRLSTGGTPITDARKIPLSTSPNRAEKRKLLESELNCSLSSPSRRRARLGGGGLALALSGPPLRKNYSPSVSGSRPSSVGPDMSLPSTAALSRIPSLPPSHEVSVSAPSRVTEPSSRLDNYPTISKAKSSSFKVKCKVTETTRHKVDPTDMEPPPPSTNLPPVVPQLKVDQLPTFNLTPTPAPKPPTTSNGLTQASLASEPVERNNNKSPLKRHFEPNEHCDPPKKLKGSGIVEGSEVSKSVSSPCNSAKKQPSSKVEPKSRVNIIQTPPTSPPPMFSFSAPKTVIEKAEGVTLASQSFTFSTPETLRDVPSSQVTNGPSNLNDVIGTSNKCRGVGGSVDSPARSEVNFMYNKTRCLPDVTNNLLKKSPAKEKLKGSSSRLPDLTESTGFGGCVPAKELKSGSVMDILGKKA